MSAVCDNRCDSGQPVIRGFVKVWNGNQVDLCMRCAYTTGLVALLDNILGRAQGVPPEHLPTPAGGRHRA